MIYLLVTCTFILLVITYLGVGNDLMHPAVLICGSYFLCICAAIYNLDYWGVEYHIHTVFIILVALSCISFISIFCVRCFPNKTYSFDIQEKYSPEMCVEINRLLYIFFLLLSVGTTMWYLNVAIKEGGSGSITDILSGFRMASSYGMDEEFSMPFLLNQLIKFNKVLAYFMTLVFINNLIVIGKRQYYLLIFAVFFILQSVIGGNRQYVLYMVIECVIASYIMVKRFRTWRTKNELKYVKIIGKAFIALVIFFIFAGNLLGRSTLTLDPLRAITTYIGGAVALLELFLQNPDISVSALWGEETFSSIYKTIMDGKTGTRHLEFRSNNGIVIGNIYGALRKYYYDFNIIGTILLCILFGLIFSLMYKYWIKNERICRPLSYRLCVYTLIMHCTIYFPLDDLFYSGVLSINYLTQFLLLWLVYYFTVKYKLKFRLSNI